MKCPCVVRCLELEHVRAGVKSEARSRNVTSLRRPLSSRHLDDRDDARFDVDGDDEAAIRRPRRQVGAHREKVARSACFRFSASDSQRSQAKVRVVLERTSVRRIAEFLIGRSIPFEQDRGGAEVAHTPERVGSRFTLADDVGELRPGADRSFERPNERFRGPREVCNATNLGDARTRRHEGWSAIVPGSSSSGPTHPFKDPRIWPRSGAPSSLRR
jgi:hypothetical protein